MNQEKPGKTHISHYQIVSRIGTGGMGEVYLAEDARLGRKVALKVLLDNHAADSDTRRRFGQEARAASGLNHPNIITIYETGEWENEDYIAMEFVEGQSVRDLITQKKLSLGDAINIAAQVASALAAAHAVGIVHRDIKPENIILRPDGLVKVLDFGLAKQTSAVPEPIEVDSEAPTYGAVGTLPGMVMGTVPYMSPEQARGKPVDQRTDVWSLGVVLYEMISGRPPFGGETKSDLLAAILTRDPAPLHAGTPEYSREIDHIVRKTLVKDRDGRYQSVKDLALDLRLLQGDLGSGSFNTEALSHTTAEETVVPTHGRTTGAASETAKPAVNWQWPAALAAALIAAAVLWFAWKRMQPSGAGVTAPITSTQITTWKSDLAEGHTDHAQFSPDGKLIAYVAPKDGRSSIWLKQVAGGEPFTRKQDDSSDYSPIWSHDGERIAYISNRDGSRAVWAAPALGGSPLRIAPIDARSQLVHWSRDGSTIYYDAGENLYAIDVSSGQSTKLTDMDDSAISDRDFSVSPDEQKIAYTDRQNGQRDIWIATINGENPVRITDDAFEDRTPIWHPDGRRIIYTSDRDGTKQIFVVPVRGGEPTQVMLSDGDLQVSDVSPDGKQILYHSEKDDSDIWGVDLENDRQFQVTSDLGPEFWPEVSPDGRLIVYQAGQRSSLGAKVREVSIFARPLGTQDAQPTQITRRGFDPQWSPDGRQVAFLRDEAGVASIWLASARGGDERRIADGGVMASGYTLLPYLRLQPHDLDWSPDGRSIVYATRRGGIANIARVETAGGETQLTANAEKDVLFLDPIFSPDGTSVAWLSMKLGPPASRSWSIMVLKDQQPIEAYRATSPVRLLGWRPDGTGLIVQTSNAASELARTPVDISLFEVSPAGGPGRKLAELRAVYMHNVALTPDRRSVIYVTHAASGDAVEMQPIAGGTPKRIAASSDPRVYFSNFAFSPDGKTVFYGTQANWQIISAITNFK